MLERLDMSRPERDRLHAIRNVLDGRIKQTEAARILGRTERHIRRLCARVRAKGDAALMHGLRGRPSNHRLDEEVLEQALTVLHGPLWEGFGPTFSRDKLDELYGIKLGTNTIRRLMLLTDLWEAKRYGVRHRAWRERRSCVGMLVQLDGSDHAWFEGRGPRCALIIYIDDATSRILYGEFVKVEDTLTLMRTTKAYLRQWGRPVAFYVDKDSIYTVNRSPSAEVSVHAAEDPITQFTRAMGELAIEVKLAHSPQAKGRVERGFGTHQDRLVKELRLAGISTMTGANRLLREVYIPTHNRRYAVEPAKPLDVHKSLLPSHNLDSILSIQEERQIHNDSTVRFDNRFFLLTAGHGLRPKTSVTVQQRLDGTLRIAHMGCQLRFEELPERPRSPERMQQDEPRVRLPRLPRNPFFSPLPTRSSDPTNAPASAVMS